MLANLVLCRSWIDLAVCPCSNSVRIRAMFARNVTRAWPLILGSVILAFNVFLGLLKARNDVMRPKEALSRAIDERDAERR